MNGTSNAISEEGSLQVRKIRSNCVGVAQGQTLLFSDYRDDGQMWTGSGDRQMARNVRFDEAFQSAPVVHLSFSLLDLDQSVNPRLDLQANDITPEGFQISFATWGDSRVARIRVLWTAIGEVGPIDDWDVD